MCQWSSRLPEKFHLYLLHLKANCWIWVKSKNAIIYVYLDMKAFQYDAYHPLANCTCFSGHQMPVLVIWGVLKWTSYNRSLVVATRCHYQGGIPFPMSGEGALYSEVKCIMGKGHMGPPLADRHTSENITFPLLIWRAVISLETVYGLIINMLGSTTLRLPWNDHQSPNTIISLPLSVSIMNLVWF